MKDPVNIDEARHDRDQQKALDDFERDKDYYRERASEEAWEEYDAGRLDDRLAEIVMESPYDAMRLAKHVRDMLESDQRYDSALMWKQGFVQKVDRLALKDFRATVQGMVEDRAEEILEKHK